MLPEQNYGTGNINDTNVDLVRQQAFQMLNYVKSDPVAAALTNTQERYSLLYNKTKTIFNMILKEATAPLFNESEFTTKLDNMLNLIKKIQAAEVSQYDASGQIGKILASEYIDVVRKQ